MNESLAFAFSVIALIMALCALGLSVFNLIEVFAAKRSTHQVQWQSIPAEDYQSPEDMAKILGKDGIEYERDQF